MKTVLFFIRLFVNPFGTMYSSIFNKKKKDNGVLKILKVALGFIIGLISLVLLVVVLADDKENGAFAGSVQFDYSVPVYKPNEQKEELLPDNPDGTTNGLNLQLIDQIATEGYVKEILTLYRASAQNGIDDYEFQVPLEYKIGIQIDETGPYNQTLLPKSYLPTKSDGSVVWKESFDGIPAEQMTVKNLNPENAVSLVAKYPSIYGQMSYNVGTSLFQGLYQNQAGTEVNGFPACKLNWLGSSSGRGARTYYQPDGMSYLNGRITRFVNSFFTEEYKQKLKENSNIVNMCVAPIHNAGEAGFLSPLVYGSHWSDVATYDSASTYMALESLYNDLTSSANRHSIIKSKYFGHGGRFVGAYLLCEAGWSFTSDGLGFLENSSGLTDDLASTLLGSGKTSSDLMNYFRSKVSSLPISDSEAISNYGWYSSSNPWKYYGNNSTKGFMFKYDSNKTVTFKSGKTVPFLSVINNESLGQLYSTLFHGSYIYATALKYAGVNVDPTNPNSYMDTLPEGEWKPSGDSIWMTNEKVDMDKLDSTGEKILNEGHKYIGLPYIFGGNDPDVGLDCSSFVQWTYRRSLGIELPRVTYQQARLGKEVSTSEAKPGDLVFYYTTNRNDPDHCEHVAIFLGMDGNQPRILHAPEPGKTIGITTWDGSGYYNDWSIRRLTD